jgi:RNA polymerase sigma-70 factor (ECF subfamily)
VKTDLYSNSEAGAASDREQARDSGSEVDDGYIVAVLVTDAKTGDRKSLERLAALFHQKVFGLVYHRTGNRMDAEDLTQDVFVEMTKSIKKLRDPRSFKGWLCRIALNRVKDFHRRRKLQSFWARFEGEEHIETREDVGSPLDQIQAKEFWRQLHGLVQKMPGKERETFLLRYVDHLRIREIADTLRISESAVKTHLQRALKKLKSAPTLRELVKEHTS